MVFWVFASDKKAQAQTGCYHGYVSKRRDPGVPCKLSYPPSKYPEAPDLGVAEAVVHD